MNHNILAFYAVLETNKTKENNMTQVKDLEYYKNNAEEDYLTTPISVLRYIGELEAELHKTHVINWVAITDKKPKTEWGDFLICLENNTIHKANYSTIAGERWLVVGVGEICEDNPVKYWAELPSPPCA